jgi:hypothetical protein
MDYIAVTQTPSPIVCANASRALPEHATPQNLASNDIGRVGSGFESAEAPETSDAFWPIVNRCIKSRQH